MSKSIKQLADELGVSKTAVRKKIVNLGLQNSLQKNKNQLLITDDVEKLIKSAFASNETKTRKPQTDSAIENEIAFLRAEIIQKNEQIRIAQEEQARLLQIIDDNNIHLANMEEMLKAELFLKVQAENRVIALEDHLAEAKKSWFQKLFS